MGHEDILRYEEILRVVNVAVDMGITKIRITGGEPLVRRGIVGFISQLAKISGLLDISLTTNGILLESFAAPLREAGVKRINISLDSLDAVKYAHITRGGDLQAVLRGIDSVCQVGFHPIKINVVLIRGVNDDEIEEFALLSLTKPFQIRFIELMPLGTAGSDYEGKYLSNNVAFDRINNLYRLNKVQSERSIVDGPAHMYKIDGALGQIGFISPISHDFCHSCNRLRLTADGHLRACLLTDSEISLKEALRDSHDDRELRNIINSAVSQKPMQHQIGKDKNHVRKCVTEMSSLGG